MALESGFYLHHDKQFIGSPQALEAFRQHPVYGPLHQQMAGQEEVGYGVYDADSQTMTYHDLAGDKQIVLDLAGNSYRISDGEQGSLVAVAQRQLVIKAYFAAGIDLQATMVRVAADDPTLLAYQQKIAGARRQQELQRQQLVTAINQPATGVRFSLHDTPLGLVLPLWAEFASLRTYPDGVRAFVFNDTREQNGSVSLLLATTRAQADKLSNDLFLPSEEQMIYQDDTTQLRQKFDHYEIVASRQQGEYVLFAYGELAALEHASAWVPILRSIADEADVAAPGAAEYLAHPELFAALGVPLKQSVAQLSGCREALQEVLNRPEKAVDKAISDYGIACSLRSDSDEYPLHLLLRPKSADLSAYQARPLTTYSYNGAPVASSVVTSSADQLLTLAGFPLYRYTLYQRVQSDAEFDVIAAYETNNLGQLAEVMTLLPGVAVDGLAVAAQLRPYLGHFDTFAWPSGFFTVTDDAGNMGVMSPEGELVVPPRFSSVEENDYGLRVELAGDQQRYGVYSKTGQLLLEPQYPMVYGLDDKRLIVTLNNDQQQIFDLETGTFKGVTFDQLEVFSEQQLLKVSAADKCWFLRWDLSPVVPQFEAIGQQVADSFIVTLQGKQGVFNPATGQFVVPASYRYIINYADYGLISALDGETSYFKLDGTPLLPADWQALSIPFDDPGYITARDPHGQAGLVSNTGEILIPPHYAQLGQFKSGRAVARKTADTRLGLINIDEQVIIPYRYEDLKDPGENSVWAKSDGKWCLIDFSQKTLVPFAYDELLQKKFIDDVPVVVVKQGQLCGLVDWDTGAELTPVNFERCDLRQQLLIRAGEAMIYPDDFR